MSGILNVGTRALQANQVALQTAGNNIANVNTPGYSRQTAVMQTVPSQFTGAGYIGKGVEVSTIERAYSEFLTRQSALASATSSGDTARAAKLTQLETLFQGGTGGLGAAVSDMLNAFSDVATAPTDLSARTVALTRVSETAQRLSNTATSMDDLQQSLTLELKNKVTSINTLATSIASVNEKIARAQGNGQQPNDLLDQRDQLVRDLNQYIQTSSIPASDGTLGIFIGGSQALVLGNTTATLSLAADDFGVRDNTLTITRNGVSHTLDENTLGGGEVSGLLRFQNTDLAEARNLLGRYSLAVTTSMNDQHALGLDLNGNAGGNLFSANAFVSGANKVFTASHVLPATADNSAPPYALTLSLQDTTKLAASDYAVSFTSATAGSILRGSDNTQIGFGYTAATGQFLFQTATDPAGGPFTGTTFDGLSFSTPATTAVVAGDRFLINPFNTSASNISAEFSSPRSLAVASPIAGKVGAANTGTLQLASLSTLKNPPVDVPVTIRFTGPNTYIRSDEVTGPPALDFNNPTNFASFTPYAYVSGTAIGGSIPATTPLSNWSLTLQGAPKFGDTFTVLDVKDSSTDALTGRPYNNGIDLTLNAGNASALMKLRDVATFDGASLVDGYAGLIAQIGVRSQSASYTAGVSSAIADSIEKDRTAVSGVNLDEEAAKLLQYQQAYQASAKVIQIAQGIFDTLIQTISR